MTRASLWSLLLVAGFACSEEQDNATGPQRDAESKESTAKVLTLPYREQPEGLDFVLYDVARNEVSLSDFRGRPVVMTFFYRSCPEANMCPMLMSKIREVAEGLADTEAEVLAISFDPVNDTPENLELYAESKEIRFRLLTGHADAIAEVARDKFGIDYQKRDVDPSAERDSAIDVYDHNMKTFVIDAKGELVRTFPGSRWVAEDVVRAVQKLDSNG